MNKVKRLNKFYGFGRGVLPLSNDTETQLFKLIPLIEKYYPKAEDVRVENFWDPEDDIEILSVIIYSRYDINSLFDLTFEAAKKGIDIFIMTNLKM